MTTNNEIALSRADMRRAWKILQKKEQYDKSGFLDLHWGHIVPKSSRSKYTPHIGKKQIGRYA